MAVDSNVWIPLPLQKSPLLSDACRRNDDEMLTGQRLEDHVRDVAAALADDLGASTALDGVSEPGVHDALRSCLERLAESECWGPANQIPSSLFWNPNAEILKSGSLQWHARSKPLGYAGDFRLLDRICRDDLTDNPVGKPMDVFFQAQAAPQAVRNRYRLIATMIAEQVQQRDGAYQIASIGSGPGWDIDWAIDKMSSAVQRLDVTLIDIDPRALEFCRSRLNTRLVDSRNSRLKTVQANLGRLPRLKKTLAEIEGSDLIYCAGYFDYLNDEDAITMLRALWSCVADGGDLLVFNFNEDNPSRAYMEWFGNWYLQYRTPDSLHRIAESAALDRSQIEVGTEPARVNLFLRCRKK